MQHSASELIRCDLLKNSYLCMVKQHHSADTDFTTRRCDLLKNSYLCMVKQHLSTFLIISKNGCDLLKNSYLCMVKQHQRSHKSPLHAVVIC